MSSDVTEVLVFPAMSVTAALKECIPSINEDVVICQVPSALTVVCPICCPLLNNCTDAPTSAVPTIVGVASLVRRSLLLNPESLAVDNLRVGAGVTVSKVKATANTLEVLP